VDKEELDAINSTKAEYVMRHAPHTIKETDLGIDTLDLVVGKMENTKSLFFQ